MLQGTLRAVSDQNFIKTVKAVSNKSRVGQKGNKFYKTFRVICSGLAYMFVTNLEEVE